MHRVRLAYASGGNWVNVENIGVQDTVPHAMIANLATTSIVANRVTLTWISLRNDRTTGIVSSYLVGYGMSPVISENVWNTDTSVKGFKPRTRGTTQTLTIVNLFLSTYDFATWTQDLVGTSTYRFNNCTAKSNGSILDVYMGDSKAVLSVSTAAQNRGGRTDMASRK